MTWPLPLAIVLATIGKHGGVGFGFVFARDPAVLERELAGQDRAGLVRLCEAAK